VIAGVATHIVCKAQQFEYDEAEIERYGTAYGRAKYAAR